jgi:MoaA/NifB/PqqE/SkfB family radical SAM enzyme
MVVKTGANPPTPRVYFQCRHCYANLAVDRKTMEELLSNQPDPLVGVGMTIWGECRGKW